MKATLQGLVFNRDLHSDCRTVLSLFKHGEKQPNAGFKLNQTSERPH